MEFSPKAFKILGSMNKLVYQGAAFILGIIVLAFIDFQFGAVLFDEDSIYPFLTLLILPAGLFFKVGWHAITLARRSCVAIGIMVSSLNCIALVGRMSEPDQVFIESRLLYSPLALGIILSYLFSLIETKAEYGSSLTKKETIFSLVAFSCSLIMAWYLVSEGGPIRSLTNNFSLAMTICILIIIQVHKDFFNLSIIERTFKASLYCCITAAALGISFWAYAAGTNQPEQIGYTLAFTLPGVLYGSAMAAFATFAGGQTQLSEKNSMHTDWHLIESYVFITLLILPPLNLIELALKS